MSLGQFVFAFLVGDVVEVEEGSLHRPGWVDTAEVETSGCVLALQGSDKYRWRVLTPRDKDELEQLLAQLRSLRLVS